MSFFGLISSKWRSLGVQGKLHILIQGFLILVFLFFQQWVLSRFETQIAEEAEARAVEMSDGLINGMNLLMLTGKIGDPENRKLLLKKMADAKDVDEMRIIRAKQVQDQFGPGLPEEQPTDPDDRKVIESGKPLFKKFKAQNGRPMLKVVVPFIARENFRGTNCLSCHHVKAGSVNGAASIVLDFSEEEAKISVIEKWLWGAHLVVQLIVFFIISWFIRMVVVRDITNPVKNLQATMSQIQRDGNLSRRAEVDDSFSDLAEMADTFNSFVQSLELANERLDLFAKVFENSGEGITITDAKNNIVTVNKAVTQITGYSQEDLVGKNPRIMSSGRQGREFYKVMWDSINDTGHWQGEIWNRRKSGEIYPQWLSISAVKNNQGRIVNHISIFTDITKRKEADERIQFLAHYDPLTHLPNRTLFGDRLNQALMAAKRTGTKISLLFLDLDRFKSINDSLGHVCGDALLQSVAVRLKKCVRESDTICRQGGDEFMILLCGFERGEDVAHVAEKIIAEMSEPHFVGDQSLTISFSIGASVYPEDGVEADVLIKNADAAMYYAKAKGRNNFQFFRPEMNEEAFERLSLENDLRQALKNQELFLHYQPQFNIRTGELVGIEALIRWQHPKRGLILPDKFIPMAEECGLIVSIGDWVLRTACRQNKKWQEEELFFVPVSVNLAAHQFQQKNFSQILSGILKESGLEGRYLEIELTERVIMQDADATVLALYAIKAMGVMLSIDDFGTGYSSLSYLKRFPIDKLKIDRTFVRDITTDADDAAITQTIVTMGHSLRLKVIAEGVETLEQQEFLREQNCDEIQGFYSSRPLSAEALEKMVKAKKI